MTECAPAGLGQSRRREAGLGNPSPVCISLKQKKKNTTKEVQCERDSAQNNFSHCHAQGFVSKDGAKGRLEGCRGTLHLG